MRRTREEIESYRSEGSPMASILGDIALGLLDELEAAEAFQESPDVDEETQRARAYLVCQERGHKAIRGFATASAPPQSVCEFCGTYFWVESVHTPREGFRKPSDAAIAAARASR